nr:MAG TPA: hypothetical protein [Bacteriophage sp.]
MLIYFYNGITCVISIYYHNIIIIAILFLNFIK